MTGPCLRFAVALMLMLGMVRVSDAQCPAEYTKKAGTTKCAAAACTTTECCTEPANNAKCADVTAYPGGTMTWMKKKASPPTDCSGKIKATCTNCFEKDATKCGGIADADMASTCDSHLQMFDPSKYGTAHDGTAADKKAKCCTTHTCATAVAHMGQCTESAAPMFDNALTTALSGADTAAVQASAKSTCCKAAATCASITCATGYQKVASPPTNCDASVGGVDYFLHTSCTTQSCCEASPADTTKCATATVTCDGDKVKGNPTATAGTDAAAKKANCCVDKQTCDGFESTGAAAATTSGAHKHPSALPAVVALAAAVAIAA